MAVLYDTIYHEMIEIFQLVDRFCCMIYAKAAIPLLFLCGQLHMINEQGSFWHRNCSLFALL